MSARVFNPVIMSEMRRMLRGAGVGGSGVVAFPESGVQSSSTITTALSRPDDNAIARVSRDLFGPVDHEESRRFVENELSEQRARDADHWGFDFVQGTPRRSGPGSSRFIWEKVKPHDKIPEPYALRRMTYLSRFDADDVVPTPATTATEVEDVTSSVPEVASSAATNNNKQTRITDFMRNRKRVHLSKSTLMTTTTTTTEPKKARLSNS